jgi:BirA family biotin operon repressor/biotin-[acetyl-CoA-carboxylase] ligase
LKWPNDLLVDGAKLAGVLVETRGLDPAAPHAVIGIGFDVAQRAFPAELLAERAATSLALLGIEATVDDAREHLLRSLARRLDQALRLAPELAADFLAAAHLADRRVRVELPDAPREGHLLALTFDRGLLLRTPSGPLHLPVEHIRAVHPLDPRA